MGVFKLKVYEDALTPLGTDNTIDVGVLARILAFAVIPLLKVILSMKFLLGHVSGNPVPVIITLPPYVDTVVGETVFI